MNRRGNCNGVCRLSGLLATRALAVIMAGGAAYAPAQPCDWLPGEGVGTDDVVHATTTWDPDGPGPEPELLIVGGQFTIAGDVLANNISAWDGSAWQTLGSGMGMEDATVWALTVYNGELIAGGGFTTAGGVPCNNVARWDGSTWQPLGLGTEYGVRALTVYNGELIAGGGFTIAGGVPCDRIARWNGSAWQPLGSGMWGCEPCCPHVSALTVYSGELIAGGGFTTAGGVPCNCIARWDGSTWQALGSGMSGSFSPNLGPTVSSLAVCNGELIAGGNFTSAGGVPCNNIARWDGSGWEPLGSGMWGFPFACAYALTVYNGELIAGGDFTSAGGVSCNYIARWDGGTWQSLGQGMNGNVYALAVYNGELIVGGDFTTAGDHVSYYWARWSCGFSLGDLNCDGAVNVFDIDPFVLALTYPPAYMAAYPECDMMLADCDADGWITAFDIDPFVLLLTGK
jgi:hypothetical protein